MISLFEFNIVSLVVLFVWTLAGSFGAPGILLLMLSAGAISETFPQLGITILVAYFALVIGDILVYEISRKFSEPVYKRLSGMSFFKKNEERVRNLLSKYEFVIIFFTRFAILALCVVINYVAGFERLNRKKFYSGVIFGEFLYAAIYISLGFFIGAALGNLINAINQIMGLIILSILASYLIYNLVKRLIRKKN